jgi:hypothetical protein
VSIETSRDPRFVESGLRGARKRWGEVPRTVSLKGLTDDQRRFIVDTVEELRAAARRSQ